MPRSTKQQRIFVAGASGRALAASCLKAKYPVSVVDLFADADTLAICRNSDGYLLPKQPRNFAIAGKSLEDVWQRLSAVVERHETKFGEAPIILLTGGLENTIAQIESSDLPQSAALRRWLMTRQTFNDTGNWLKIKTFCQQYSIAFPNTSSDLLDFRSTTPIIIKTNFSSGGLGIEFASEQTSSNRELQPHQFFQQYLHGRSISGTFVTASQDQKDPQHCETENATNLIGVCESYPPSAPRHHRSHRNEFRYTGSMGPIDSMLPKSALREISRAGTVAARHFQIRGVFGIDFIYDDSGVTLLEINPRVPASAEILERAIRATSNHWSIVQYHLDAILGRASPLDEIAKKSGDLHAKQILYLDETVEPILVDQETLHQINNALPSRTNTSAFISDVPNSGTTINAGEPILTLHYQEKSIELLDHSMRHWGRHLKQIFQRSIAATENTP